MKDSRMTTAQYFGGVVLLFVLFFGSYMAGYKHGEENLWREVEKEIKYKYIPWDPCDTPPWRKQEKL